MASLKRNFSSLLPLLDHSPRILSTSNSRQDSLQNEAGSCGQPKNARYSSDMQVPNGHRQDGRCIVFKVLDHRTNSFQHESTPNGSHSRTRPKNIESRPVLGSTLCALVALCLLIGWHGVGQRAHALVGAESTSDQATGNSGSPDQIPQPSNTAASCFGGLQTFEKISMASFENPAGMSTNSFGSGILIQQDDQALTSECINLCRSQSNCLSFVIDYNKFECKSYATTQLDLQQEFESKFQTTRSLNTGNDTNNTSNGYIASASTTNSQSLLPSASSNYFEKICLDGVANRNQFNDVCGQGRLWVIERVIDSFLDGYVEKEVTNVNSKDECSKLCIFEMQFICRSADYDQQSRLCRLSKEDRRTQPQAMRHAPGSNRHYLENQCSAPGPSSCVYESRKGVSIISMDALKFAQTSQDCQMKCNQETTFNCRSYSFFQQRCFLSGDDSSSLNSNLIKLPAKQGWQFGEKKCLVELCTKGIFTYEKITGHALRSALSSPIDLMMSGASGLSLAMIGGDNIDELERLQQESSQTRLRQLLPSYGVNSSVNKTSSMVSTMMMMAANSDALLGPIIDPLQASASSQSQQSGRSGASNLAITDHCRHTCDLGYLNCPAFTIDYRNNRCQRLDRNSQGRHHELVPKEGFSYYEKICLRVPEIMSMCQDKFWIFERVIGYELAPRLYEKSLKFVQSRRDCEEYCLEERQFQCRSALYNDETSDCKLSRYNRRLMPEDGGGYYRNFNNRISYLENQCIRDHQAEIKRECAYEQARDQPAYPTFTEQIQMVPPPSTHSTPSAVEMESPMSSVSQPGLNSTSNTRGLAYCEHLCNENVKFECHSFGYYASTAQCFLSGDDSVSAGDTATTPSSGFTYYEKRCKMMSSSSSDTSPPSGGIEPGAGAAPDTATGGLDPGRHHVNGSSEGPSDALKPVNGSMSLNPYFQPPRHHTTTSMPTMTMPQPSRPSDSGGGLQPPNADRTTPSVEITNDTHVDPEHYKCGRGHTFVYQRISGFEPIGGYLTVLVKNNEQPGIVAECAELCRKAYECRAYVVDYNNNQCFAMLENSSVGMLSLRQTLGKDYFEGFCISNHVLMAGHGCRNKTWVVDKIVDQAVVGVQHQKIIPESDRVQCRQACLEERLFWCKSAMFDSTSGECKLYSIDRESIPQMRLLFTRGVDFFENQCQISSNLCPYDAIERDMTILTVIKSTQARSTFDCEHACNTEANFNCRSYTYLEQYPSLPNMCLLSSDSRSTSQRGTVREHTRTLYAERNCYYRKPRYPSGSLAKDPPSMQVEPPVSVWPGSPASTAAGDYQPAGGPAGYQEDYGSPARPSSELGHPPSSGPSAIEGIGPGLGQGCEPHQFTFERTFGYDYRLAVKERAPFAPTIGIAIACQQECLRRGDRCQSFVVEYSLPYQGCFLIETQVGANKKLLVRSQNSAYFEKVCMPRTGVEPGESHAAPHTSAALSMPSADIAPGYSSEPWVPAQAVGANHVPYYFQQQQLVKNYPGRSCAKLWSFERFINHNFTIASDKSHENVHTRAQCETFCLNEAAFACRAATYDYSNRLCRLFKNTRRTIMSQFVDLESASSSSMAQASSTSQATSNVAGLANSTPGSAHVISPEADTISASSSNLSLTTQSDSAANRRQYMAARQMHASSTAEPTSTGKNIDYMENTCTPEPSSCQHRQLYDVFSPYIDKITHALSLSDCQRQCDLERLFSCKSINYDPSSKNCMLINEDLVSLNRGQQTSLLPKKNTIYSEKGNCELISVQCNSQEMLVTINFDTPFRGRLMAKGNPDQCYMIGDGQTNVQFPIVFGPKCNSRQEGHNTFVNEIVIQQHPVIMTDSDKTIRVMCAFEAPDQIITLKNPTSRDNKTGIDVGAPEISRTRNDKAQFNSVVSNKAAPPSVLLRILDPHGRDASMINLGDDLMLRIQMQMDSNGQNSALGIFARNLLARSSNGETLLLIDKDGCPVDPQVFPALEIDPKDGKSLYSTFKAFRFPSSGMVNFEVQIRFCPERCQPVDCRKGQRMRSYGRRRKREAGLPEHYGRTSIIQSVQSEPASSMGARGGSALEPPSTVMKPGKAFQYIRQLMFAPQPTKEESDSPATTDHGPDLVSKTNSLEVGDGLAVNDDRAQPQADEPRPPAELAESTTAPAEPAADQTSDVDTATGQLGESGAAQDATYPVRANSSSSQMLSADPGLANGQTTFQKSILMHVDERVVPQQNTGYKQAARPVHSQAPYGRFPVPEMNPYSARSPGRAPAERQFPERGENVDAFPESPGAGDEASSRAPGSDSTNSGAPGQPPADSATNLQSDQYSPIAEQQGAGNVMSPTSTFPPVDPTQLPSHTGAVAAGPYAADQPLMNSPNEESTSALATAQAPPAPALAGGDSSSEEGRGHDKHAIATMAEKGDRMMSAKDVPLRFSILVGENQPPANIDGGWAPGKPPPLVVHGSNGSTRVDLDHIVVPGRADGQFGAGLTSSGSSNDAVGLQSDRNRFDTTAAPNRKGGEANYNEASSMNHPKSIFPTASETLAGANEGGKRGTALYEQTFDALPSNSVAAEVQPNHAGQTATPHYDMGTSAGLNKRVKPTHIHQQANTLSSSGETAAASHDCNHPLEQGPSGGATSSSHATANGKLWTIIWTGTFVIALNVFLVVTSLVLYFKKVHFRQQHDIMRVSSEFGTHPGVDGSSPGRRWPMFWLKKKNSHGTSLTPNEHFFCKLDSSKPIGGSGGMSGNETYWPNLSSSSCHSTISSMASPLPVTSIRINQTRPHKLNFDSHPSTRNNFSLVRNKSSLEPATMFDQCNINGAFANNINDTHPEPYLPR